MTTYPPARPGSELTPGQVHYLLKNPNLVTRRLADLLERKFLVDFLLAGRLQADGGAVVFERGYPTVDGAPEVIAAGGEYPLALVKADASYVETKKWGLASIVTDEAISRMQIDPVDRALTAIAAEILRTTDAVGLGIITSLVTGSLDVTSIGAWTAADAIVRGVLTAKAEAEEADEGVNFDAIVLRPRAYAAVMAYLVAGDIFPREAAGNPLTNGSVPKFLGLDWVSSPYAAADPLLVDRDRLGAVAFEKLGGGYTTGTAGVEAKTYRNEGTDAWTLQGRRVSAAVVLDPGAGLVLTGTGL
ncbi:hypothetical protein AADG42_18215 [Ammonicoccus fulvus]|uniref:Major capsid protein n=1 Tax=Ammonicoccus fulvus TaxID=3138240 RepID=A0ABZ3FVH9_9ACTN